MGKKLCIVVLLITLATCNWVNVKAAKTSWGTSKSFSSKWSATKTWVTDSSDSGFTLTCTYGFDTFMTNEDYVKDCKSTLLSHEAAVKNSKGNGVCTGLYKPGYTSGKADVKHTGSKVTYYMATQAVL